MGSEMCIRDSWEADRPHLDACLAEHGRAVLEQDALAGILAYFPA